MNLHLFCLMVAAFFLVRCLIYYFYSFPFWNCWEHNAILLWDDCSNFVLLSTVVIHRFWSIRSPYMGICLVPLSSISCINKISIILLYQLCIRGSVEEEMREILELVKSAENFPRLSCIFFQFTNWHHFSPIQTSYWLCCSPLHSHQLRLHPSLK